MKPLFALLAALVLALGGCSAGEAPGSAGDAAGEDRPGLVARVLAPAEYDLAQEFHNGYAFACKGEDCGYIDRSGTFLPLYTFPEESREVFLQCLAEGGLYNQLPASEEGLVPVCGEAGLWGYYDLGKGERVIPCRYKTGVPFSEGRAAVCWEEAGATRYGVIDTAGELVFSVDGISGGVYKNGLLAVQLPGEDVGPEGEPVNRWALVDREGRAVVENYGAGIQGRVTVYGYPQITGSDFENTLDPEHIVLYRQSPDPERAAASYTVVNSRGEVQFADDSLCFLSGFSEGYAFYQAEAGDRRLGVIDGSGKRLSGQVLENAAGFFGGVCWFQDEAGRFGFVDTGGRVLTAAVYTGLSGIAKNGRASVEKDGKYGLVDFAGAELLPFRYDYLYSDGGEVLIFGEGERYGLLGTDGRVVAEAVYDGIGTQQEGTFLMVLGGKYGFLALTE